MTEQQVIAKIKGKALGAIDTAFLETVAKKSASLVRQLIIKRILSGKDLYGNNFGSYSKSYNKQNAYDYAIGKHGSYKYASSSVNDKLRLTGRLLNDIIVKSTRVKKTANQVTFDMIITVQDRVKAQAEGLQSTVGVTAKGTSYAKKAWYFLGISKQLGEQDKLKNYLIAQLNAQLGTITTKNK
jgi:hypothetical protein